MLNPTFEYVPKEKKKVYSEFTMKFIGKIKEISKLEVKLELIKAYNEVKKSNEDI